MSDEAFTSYNMLAGALKKELESTNNALAIAGIVNDVDGSLTSEQLSREASEAVIQDEIQQALTKNSVNEVAAAVRVAHEATRARRDIQIVEASHKKLMLGCYKTMYQRKLKLENRLQREDYV
jgi:hypothetical protein